MQGFWERILRNALFTMVALGLTWQATEARAGGVASLFGPAGIHSGFAVDEEKDFATLWRVDLAGGVFNTELKIAGQTFDTIQYGIMALAEVYPIQRLGIHFGIGALVAGSLTDGDTDFEMDPGVAGAFGLSVAALHESDVRPFILFGADFTVAWARTKAKTAGASKESYTALDGRITMTIGKTLPQGVTLYVKGQGLLGKVYWDLAGKSVTGDDRYHYSAGFGMWVNLPHGMMFFFEAMPAGERSVKIGYGAAF